jgi:thioredoxin-related protein
MMRLLPWSLAGVVVLASCAKLGIGSHAKPGAKPSAFGSSGIPPQLRAKNQDGGSPVVPGGNAPNPATAPILTPDEDIVFTDPDNPDAKLPELSTLLAAPKRGPWEESETIAKQRAAREGKPLLIWFTDSARSPMCKALAQELFATPDFEQWATEKLIRLRIDAHVQENNPDLSLGEKETRLVDLKNYVASMKKRYKVLGQPSVLMLNPSGEVIGRYRGYKRGEADYFWGLLKHGEAVSANAYQSWRAGLEKKGYRQWQDRKERKVFAKLTGFSNGTLTLIEPDGTRSRTQENLLSDKDRAWIAEQKKPRNPE